jgi:ATP-dependent RNA helicase RhlE
MSFADLGLDPELSRAVSEKGYATPTPIQSQAIPAVLEGRDVLAGAQTGTGKTAAFILPILQKLGRAEGRTPRALVLTPTRELAAQVAESAATYGKYKGLRTFVVFGGVSINPQIDTLRNGCDLLVATPGRLLDLAGQRAVDLRNVRCFVLDEADRMLDMGFIQPIRQVLKLLPPQRQNLMFSATYSEEIRELANRLLRNPVAIEVAPRNATADRVDQQVYRVVKEHKRHLLAHLIEAGGWHQVLVFTRTKHGANRLAQQLEGAGIRSAAIHGNKSQGARVRALSDFKDNKVTALVATEVAARGLDIKELPHVVNYELPNVPEDYVHRIGRTARAGGSGSAVSLVAPDEGPLLRDIERLLGRALPVTALPSFAVRAQQNEGAREHDESRRHEAPRRRTGQPQHDGSRSRPGGSGQPRNGQPRNGQPRNGQPRHEGNGDRRPHDSGGQSRQDVAGRPRQDTHGQPRRDTHGQPRRDTHGHTRQESGRPRSHSGRPDAGHPQQRKGRFSRVGGG